MGEPIFGVSFTAYRGESDGGGALFGDWEVDDYGTGLVEVLGELCAAGGEGTACDVLLAEDDDQVREVVTLALEEKGYHVIAVTDGAAVVSTVCHRQADIDAIVTESSVCKIQLAEGTGLPVFHPLQLLN